MGNIMTKKRGLGSARGLSALMNSIKKEKQFTQDGHPIKSPLNSVQDGDKLPDNENLILTDVDVNTLQSGKYQPRRNMDETSLTELASSISQHGVMQPIVIRPLLANEKKEHEKVTHEIIAGERRWRAAKMAGLTKIPAIERILSDEVAIALALIENIQREDLTVLEQAEALQRFHSEFGMSHAMIADVVGKARATVTNLLRLNQLNNEVKDLLADGFLDMGHARTLLALSSQQQPIIAKKIIQQKMTVRDAEKLVKSILDPQNGNQDAAHKIKTTQDNPNTVLLNQKLSDYFGAMVKIKQNTQGKGSLEIFFHSDDELAEIIKQLGITL